MSDNDVTQEWTSKPDVPANSKNAAGVGVGVSITTHAASFSFL
jgi:hypothetical protein